MLTVSKYRLNDFLRYVIPDFVADPDRAIKCMPGQNKHEQMRKIISAKRCMEQPEYVHIPGKYPLLDAIYYYPLGYESYNVTKKTERAVAKLKERRPGYQSCLWLATEIYAAGKVKGVPEKDRSAYRAVLAVDAMDLLGALTGSYTATDVSIELGLLYEQMVLYIKPKGQNEHLVLVNVSPYFIRRVVDNPVLQNVHITIVFTQRESKNLLRYSERLKTRFEQGKASVICLDELERQNVQLPINLMVVGMDKKISETNLSALLRKMNPQMSLGARIVVMQSSAFIDKTPQIYHLESKQICKLREVHLLPQGIPNTKRPKLKTIAIYEIIETKQKEKAIPMYYRYRLMTIAHTETQSVHYALEREFNQEISRVLAQQPAQKTVRQAYDQATWQVANQNGNNRGKSTETYYLAPELPIDYIIGDNYITVYFTRPKTEKGIEIINTSGKMIKSTYRHITSKKLVKQGIQYVEKQYPLSVIGAPKSKSAKSQSLEGREIRATVAQERLPHLKGKPISLRALWYLYPSEGLFIEKELKLIYQVLGSELGLIMPSQTSGEEMAEYIEQYCRREEKATGTITAVLEKLIDIAVNHKHATTNELRDTDVPSLRKERDRIREVTRFLSNRSLNNKQERKLYQMLERDFYTDSFAFGAALRFYTGLSSNIICALSQNSVRRIVGHEGYYLEIRHQITNDGKEIKPLLKAKTRVRFPLPPMLESVMTERKKIVEKSNIHKGAIGKTLLLFKLPDKPDVDGFESITPKELELYCRDTLQKLGLPKRTIEVVLPDKGTVELSNTRKIPNFPLSNFRHHAYNTAGMEPGDIAYLTSVNGPDTLSVHYIGYRSMAMLYNMRAALERWYATFTQPKIEVDKKCEKSVIGLDSTVIINKQNGVLLPKTQIELYIPRGVEIEIQVTAKYGAKIQVL